FDCRMAAAQSDPGIELVVSSGRAMRVMLTDGTTVHRVGQTVTGRLIEPVYAYDRIVLPVGTLVQGHVAKLTPPSKISRARSMGSGDFSPHNTIEVRFESVLRDGEPVPIETIAKNETPRVKREVAKTVDHGSETDKGAAAQVKAEARNQASAAIAGVKQQASAAVSEGEGTGRRGHA